MKKADKGKLADKGNNELIKDTKTSQFLRINK